MPQASMQLDILRYHAGCPAVAMDSYGFHNAGSTTSKIFFRRPGRIGIAEVIRTGSRKERGAPDPDLAQAGVSVGRGRFLGCQKAVHVRRIVNVIFPFGKFWQRFDESFLPHIAKWSQKETLTYL